MAFEPMQLEVPNTSRLMRDYGDLDLDYAGFDLDYSDTDLGFAFDAPASYDVPSVVDIGDGSRPPEPEAPSVLDRARSMFAQ